MGLRNIKLAVFKQPVIKMKKFISLLFILISIESISQNNYFLIDNDTHEPIEGVVLKYCDIDSISTLISDTLGKITLNNLKADSTCVELLHLNYFALKINIYNKTIKNDTVFLKRKINFLNEVTLNEKIKNTKPIRRAIVSTFFNYKINLSHNDKIAQLIKKNKFNKKIKKIKVKIIDDFGVKNLKYQPFRLSIYTVDSISQKPDSCIFRTEKIKKINKKRWVEIDIEILNLYSNNQDFFIVFEILSKNEYAQQFINSKIGLIPAVPQIKAKIFNAKDNRRCYLNKYYYDSNQRNWEYVKCQLYLDFIYEK